MNLVLPMVSLSGKPPQMKMCGGWDQYGLTPPRANPTPFCVPW